MPAFAAAAGDVARGGSSSPDALKFRAGNILLSVDGKPVRNHEEAEVLLDGFENTVPELELRDGARRIAVRMVREPPARY